MELPHPETLSVTPLEFVSFYMPMSTHREHYSRTSVQAPKQTVEKWDGKPSKFKAFLETLKAAAANMSPFFACCIENKVYAESMQEMNNTL
jgi:hypothetical protein